MTSANETNKENVQQLWKPIIVKALIYLASLFHCFFVISNNLDLTAVNIFYA